MTDLAKLEIELRGDACVARIQGEVDMSNADDLLADIERGLPGGGAALVVDLTATRYLDSAGVRVLFALADRLRSRRWGFAVLVPADAPVRAVLELMDLPSVVPLAADLESALASDPKDAP